MILNMYFDCDLFWEIFKQVIIIHIKLLTHSWRKICRQINKITTFSIIDDKILISRHSLNLRPENCNRREVTVHESFYNPCEQFIIHI